MGKVAIGSALAETLNFVFGRYLSLLGAVWVPLLLLGTIYYFAFLPIIEVLAAAIREAARHPHAQTAPPDFGAFGGLIWTVNLAVYVATAWISVGVTKAALGLRRTFPFAYVGIGWDEARILGAHLVILAMFYGGALAIVLAGLIVVGVGAAIASGGAINDSQIELLKPWIVASAVALLVAIILAIFYFMIRLTFFLAPVTVVEKRFGLWRSWELSKGNVWRILAIVIGIILLLIAVEIALVALVGIPMAFLAAGAVPHDPTAAAKFLHPFLPLVGIALLLVFPIFFGLQFAPGVFAYRSLRQNMDMMAGSS